MYLSKLTLNPVNKQVLAQLSNIYELHRTLCAAFPKDRDAERLLFRVDEGQNSYTVLVQSIEKPDWSLINEKNDFFLTPPEQKQFLPKVADGQLLAFKLRANPTMKKAGKRIGLIKEEDRLNWLRRKAGNGGFDFVQLQTIPAGIVKTQKADKIISFYSVTFQGILKVTDRAKFTETLAHGIGSGKGLGFGLLSVAPYKD